MTPKRRQWWEVDGEKTDQTEEPIQPAEYTVERETRPNRIVEVITVRGGNASPMIYTRQILRMNSRITLPDTPEKMRKLKNLYGNPSYDLDDNNDSGSDLDSGVQWVFEDAHPHAVHLVRNNPLFEARISRNTSSSI